MLRQLYIKNFTLIDELDIELHPGFSVITGETGAGKSILLGGCHSSGPWQEVTLVTLDQPLK